MADARVEAEPSTRPGRGLEIATWVMVGMNLLTLAVLAVPGAAVVALQDQITHQFDEGYAGSDAAVTGYWIGVAACTVLGNGLAIWRRRDWGLAFAIGAAAGCWIVLGVTAEGAF